MRLLAVAEMEAVEVWRYPAGVAKGLGLALDRAYCAKKPRPVREAGRRACDRWRISDATSSSDPRPTRCSRRPGAKGRVGRLKIFVGAAPGVGKTYEMLQTARAKLKEGVDIVVGVVETHGRKETEALLEGLEVAAAQAIEYKGNRILSEFDIDALLKRRPALVLVDELAHTNVPGSRHPKRYQDVEELLEAGIDVYTTVNIQHIESLNDVVAQITRVRVRETVPDSILDRADAVELVDLTPDDLIQRLKEGKVYVPKQAERALKHYFSPANLTALRELALRRTAERVDEQLLEQMQASAIPGPWAAGERILVCVSEDPRSAGLVRYAKRLADRLHAPWTALYIETRRSLQLSEEERDRIAETMRLAERLGGEAITIPAGARRIADDMLGFAHKQQRHAHRHRQVRRARAGSRSCTARSCTTWCGGPATSASTSSPARRPARERRCRRRRRRPDARQAASIRCPTSSRLLAVALALGIGKADAAPARHRERRSRVSDGHRRRRGALRPVAVAAGQRGSLALLQLLLPAAGLHLHDHRSHQRRGLRAVHASSPWSSPISPRAGAAQTVTAHGAGAHDRIALRLQPQARGRRHARRRAVGHRLPDRARC